jgi:hypothetical protein
MADRMQHSLPLKQFLLTGNKTLEKCQEELLEFRLINMTILRTEWLFKQDNNTLEEIKPPQTFVLLKHYLPI